MELKKEYILRGGPDGNLNLSIPMALTEHEKELIETVIVLLDESIGNELNYPCLLTDEEIKEIEFSS